MHGIKLGLDNISRLLDSADHPESRFPTVHVAGTNGKGSVLAFLDAILSASGYRTGRFTSPHLIRINERFLIERKPVDDDTLESAIAQFQQMAESMEPPPTFFEINTAVAYQLFADAAVDIGLIEVGLGGRFDSTNTLTPEITAITTIGLEHTQYLGDTIEKIAFEKAGIIKPRVPLVVGDVGPVALEVIEEQAREKHAPTRIAGTDYHYEALGTAMAPACSFDNGTIQLGPVPLGLSGAYQAHNAAVATELAYGLQVSFNRITDQTITEGLATASWPCRLERVLDKPPTTLDVAHNEAGAAALAEAMEPGSIVVFAVSSDKNAGAMLATLASKAGRFIITEFANRRSVPAAELAKHAEPWPHEVAKDMQSALRQAFEHAHGRVPVYITGSLFMAGEARGLLESEYGAVPMRF